MQQITTTNNHFVDDKGKTYFFHGINVVDKGWREKLPSFNKKDLWAEREFQKNPLTYEELKILKSMGVNLIRLGITWEGIEPTMGKYNDEVIKKLHDTVKLCESLNIRVLLDMHQDLYAGWGCSWGDGAPKWATITDNIPYKFPRLVWAMGYFTGDAVARAFDNFWQNREIDGIGLQDRFASMWAYFASCFNDCSNILGYDVLNEPFGGSSGRKIFSLLTKQIKYVLFHDKAFKWSKVFKGIFNPQEFFDAISAEVLEHVISPCHDEMIEFDKNYYTPFLEKLATKLREVNKNNILLVDNNYFSNIGIKTGLKPIEVNGVVDKNQCFSPHAYDFMIDTNQYNYANNERVKFIFDTHEATSKTLNLPVLVGEWGGICFKGVKWHEHIKFLLNYFDEKQWSRCYWQYRPYMYADASAYLFMRPYVSEIDGSLLKTNYDYSTNTLDIEVEVNASEKNLVIFSPCKVTNINYKEFNTIYFNTKEELLDIDNYFKENIFKRPVPKKQQKFLDKNLLDWDSGQLRNSCFLEFSLPKGKYNLSIQIKKPSNQIDCSKELEQRRKIHYKNVKKLRKM